MTSFKKIFIQGHKCCSALNGSLLILFNVLLVMVLSGCSSQSIQTNPAHGETGVAIDTVIEITFVKAVKSESLNVSFTPSTEYEGSWSIDNTTVTLTPSSEYSRVQHT